MLSVLRKMRRAQQVVLRVNRAYIASAAQADSSRTEPPFKLQGSYRNMNKLAERRGRLTGEQERRWAEVTAAYLREQALGGAADDPMSRAVGAVGLLADRVGDVSAAIGRLQS